jgi:hypothetical protein
MQPRPDTMREVAKRKFHGNRETVLRLVQQNPNGLSKDQFENGQAQVTEMARLVQTLEQHAKKKTMSEQFTKFQVEWNNAVKGKGMGKVQHYLVKMATTAFGEPDVPK